jgi:hypothetical protein
LYFSLGLSFGLTNDSVFCYLYGLSQCGEESRVFCGSVFAEAVPRSSRYIMTGFKKELAIFF